MNNTKIRQRLPTFTSITDDNENNNEGRSSCDISVTESYNSLEDLIGCSSN